MTFGKRLMQLRKEKGFTRESFAKHLDMSKYTLRNYEMDTHEPNSDFLIKLSKYFDVSIDYLMGLTEEKEKILPYELKTSEYEHIKKYRFVSEYSPSGAKTINLVLDNEYSIAKQVSEQKKQLQAQQDRIDALEAGQQKVSEIIQSIRIYTYFGRIACAGSGFYFDDIPTETIEAPDMGGDFIIGVNGDSMEPDYHDGDKLYVKKTEHISHGDVGIFTIGNECFLKEYGEEGLISRNRDYGDIPGTEDVRLIGKVIGKVEED